MKPRASEELKASEIYSPRFEVSKSVYQQQALIKKAPPGFQPQPLRETEVQTMQGIPLLLAAHLRETKRRRRNLSPREALIAHRSPMHGAYHPNQQLYTVGEGDHLRGRYGNDADSPSPLGRWIEELQFPASLKVPPYVGYYDRKGDPYNFIHDATRVWWNSLPKGMVTSYEDLKKSLTKSPREILVTKKVGKTFTKPPKMVPKTKDTSKYCEFHQDYGHDTNACRELKHQIEEVVKSGKLAHLIIRIRKGRAKQTYTQLEEWVAPAVKEEPVVEGKKEPILMIGVINNPLKRKEPPRIMSVEEMIFTPIRNRVFVYRPYPHKRTGLRKARPRIIMSEYQDIKRCEQVKRLKESHPDTPMIFFECVNPEENVVINQKYPEQTVTIGRQLPIYIRVEALRYDTVPRTLKIGDEIFITEHKLNEDKKITPVQKKRGMVLERSATTSKEVKELRKARILRETR
ncbi:hypothetical protein Tco_0340094 [Tanacetum coccineum]